jgi:hypothetical protein
VGVQGVHLCQGSEGGGGVHLGQGRELREPPLDMGVEEVHLGHGWELREYTLDMGGS